MNNRSEFENQCARAINEDTLWRTRRTWFWLMLVPTVVIILQWAVLPVPSDELPGDYERTLLIVAASWAAICATVFAGASPEDKGLGYRLGAGLLLWLGITVLNAAIMGGLSFASATPAARTHKPPQDLAAD